MDVSGPGCVASGDRQQQRDHGKKQTGTGHQSRPGGGSHSHVRRFSAAFLWNGDQTEWRMAGRLITTPSFFTDHKIGLRVQKYKSEKQALKRNRLTGDT
jgi:hypothetical protein